MQEKFVVIFIFTCFTMILKLPTEIIADILSNWVEWSSIGRLDSAICTKSTRPEFLGVLKDFTICNEVIGTEISHDMLKWVLLRSIRAVEIYKAEKFPVDPTLVASLIQLSGNKLRKFCWFDPELPSLILASITGHTSCLTSLTLQKSELDDAVWDIICANKQITQLQLSGRCGTPPLHLSSALTGTNLIKLGMSGDNLQSDAMLLLILQHTPNLRTLKAVEFEKDTLLEASQLCPKIIHLDLCNEFMKDDMDDEAFVAIISNLHDLQSVKLNFYSKITELSLSSLSTLHGHSLTFLDLYIFNAFSGSISTLINSCPKLKTLLFSNFYGRALLPAILPGVQSRNIQHLHMHCGVNENILKIVINNFPNLVTFGCFLNYSTERPVMIQARNLITQCKTLKAIYTQDAWPQNRRAGLVEEFPNLFYNGFCPELDIFTLPV